MTENLAKLPTKGILRKSSLTFVEHDDSDLQLRLDNEKPTKVIVEPIYTPPEEYPIDSEEEKARREEFELKRKILQHQEGKSVHMAKRMMSDDNIEEETPEVEDELGNAKDASLQDTKEQDTTPMDRKDD